MNVIAIGAKVTVVTSKSEHTGWMIGGDGYMCTNEATVHVGLGKGVSSVERIKIDWPSGQEQTFKDLVPDRRYLVVESDDQVFVRQVQ